MFPGVSGFEWNAGHIIFLGIFYTVVCVIAATVSLALYRVLRDFRSGRQETIAWHEDFHDMPPALRRCRHELTGEFKSRECPHAFDCRECSTHAQLVAKLPVAPAEEDEIFGLPFPSDRYYHRGHTWAKPEADGTVTVGLDALGERLLGSAGSAELPSPGAKLSVNGTAWRVKKGQRDVRVLSPVDGEVIATGGPGDEWRLKVKPTGGAFDFRHLLRGREVRAWILRELERLQLALAPAGAATLADGGVLVEDLPESHPAADWDAVYGEMFLQL